MKTLSKVLLTLAVVICCFGTTLLLTACGSKSDETSLLKAYVKAGTLDTKIYIGEELDTSNVILILELTNNIKYEIEAKDLEFDDSAIDNTKIGTYQLKITYHENITEKLKLEDSISVDITVRHQADDITVLSMSSQLLTDYRDNKKAQENKTTEFKDLNEPIYVGDDNEFNFRIVATGYDGNGDDIDLDVFRTIVTIKLLNDETQEFEELSDEELTKYVTIDTTTTTFDFTEAAVGHTFHVTVEAANTADSELGVIDTDLIVVDGFNVYTARDLSVYDNYHNDWYADIKAPGNANEADLRNIKTNGIILQDNIYITKNDVPKEFFWGGSAADASTIQAVLSQTGINITGSTKDFDKDGLYRHVVADGESFKFIGNYFSVKIDGKQNENNEWEIEPFPFIKLEWEDIAEHGINVVKSGDNTSNNITAHMTLFFNDLQNGYITKETIAECKNVSFIGNAALQTGSEASGGLIMLKNRRVNFHAYNTVTHNFCICYFMTTDTDHQYDNLTGEYLIEKCKGYNSYQCLIYNWGSKLTTFKDCEFIASGGPAIIADSIDYEVEKDNDGNVIKRTGYTSSINIIESTFASEVVGTEPWFATYEGASALALGIKALDGNLYANTPKTLINPNLAGGKINIVALMKSNHQGLTTDPVGGYIRIFKTQADFDAYYQEAQATTHGLECEETNYTGTNKNLSIAAQVQNALGILQSVENGGYISTNYTGDPTNIEYSSLALGKPYYEGDYTNLYLGQYRMGVVLGTYDRVA